MIYRIYYNLCNVCIYDYGWMCKIQTWNLAKMVYNKWLQQSKNKMNYLYKMTMDNLIRAFMQIIYYRLWLRGGSTSEGLDFASSKLKAATKCGDPKLLGNAMKSCLGQYIWTLRLCFGKVWAFWIYQMEA